MKKVIKCFAIGSLGLLFNTKQVGAQITLESQIDSSSYPNLWRYVQISPTETKYYFVDTLHQSFSLYNMDFTPFITNIPVPDPWLTSSTVYYEACYITRALFDCDTSNIEFAFTCPGNSRLPFRIYRTDGTLLFQRDSSFLVYCGGDCGNAGESFITSIVNTSSGAKMVLTSYTSGNEQNFVYSLCGTLPTDVYDLSQQSQGYVTVFPNPSSSSLTFKINPPDNVNEFEFVIVDDNAREVKRERLNSLNRNYILDASNMSSGTYLYSLCAKRKSYQTGKFILTK
jgi:hypothetical protein